MMSNLSTFDRKWLKYIILLITMAILLIVGSAVFGYDQGNYLTTGNSISYESADGVMYLEFQALISFEVGWDFIGGKCIVATSSNLNIISDDWQGFNGSWIVEDLENFDTASSCPPEIFTAGDHYKVYLIDRTYDLVPPISEAQMRANQLRDLDDETDVDEETIFNIESWYLGQWWADIIDYYLFYIPAIDIEFPPDNTEIAGDFLMEIDFEKAGGYTRLLIVFEDWDIGSSCPDISDPNYEPEYNEFFNKKSLPYFSPYFTTSTGTTTIYVSNLEIGNYNCNKCHFINENTGKRSENLCVGYDLNVLSWVPPEDIPDLYLPFESWTDYYTEHSERYATSTPIFNSLASTFEPLINSIGNIVLFFNNYFDPQNAGLKGEEFGNAIPVLRGYLEQIDDFFGDLPISALLLSYLIVVIVVIIYRLVKGVLTIIIP